MLYHSPKTEIFGRARSDNPIFIHTFTKPMHSRIMAWTEQKINLTHKKSWPITIWKSNTKHTN